MMSEVRYIVAEGDGAQGIAAEAAKRVVRIAKEAVDRSGRFYFALSGGSTPRALFNHLAELNTARRIDWQHTHIFFGDERCVPPDDDQSNYKMAKETLLDKVPVPENQIHRMEGELDPPVAAEHYEQEIRDSFELYSGAWPVFDLILLGMGPDGHTASLFPGTAGLDVVDRLAIANEVPQMKTTRLSLTVPVIREARDIMLLVGGTDKADAARRALTAPTDIHATPVQLVRQASGNVSWIFDASLGAEIADAIQKAKAAPRTEAQES
ncbi:MAG TPA: 6-phosphogluconolactonase [Thermomicrobiaceae bacterium]|nr:6-phosphogluconolactonase [Thermomicrobiaceae bacterium]